MNWFEILEDKLFDNDYDKQLINFLLDKGHDESTDNSKTWRDIFFKIFSWKNEYLINSDSSTLYGAYGWYMDYKFAEFKIPDEIKSNYEEYLYKIVSLSWLFYLNNDDIKAYENQIFIDRAFLEFEDFKSKENCTSISKEEFICDLEDTYQKSFKRFSYYTQGKNNNPKVVKNLKNHYPKFLNYINFFKENLSTPCIVRINELYQDETVWYFVFEDNKLFLILIDDFV